MDVHDLANSRASRPSFRHRRIGRATRFLLAAALTVPLVAVSTGWLCEGFGGEPPVSFGPLQAQLGDRVVPAASLTTCGLSVLAADSGPQVVVMEPAGRLTVSLENGEKARLSIPVHSSTSRAVRFTVDVLLLDGSEAEVELRAGTNRTRQVVAAGNVSALSIDVDMPSGHTNLSLDAAATHGSVSISWRNLRCVTEGQSVPVTLAVSQPNPALPPLRTPNYRKAIERRLIEWDWRLQDGIGTVREPQTWSAALARVFARGDQRIRHAAQEGHPLDTSMVREWESLRSIWRRWSRIERDGGAAAHATASPAIASAVGSDTDAGTKVSPADWESLWLRVHWLRRRMLFSASVAQTGPVAFIKRVPSCFSHQLTQYYGMCARPGGGVFVLEDPLQSMRVRQIAQLPQGSYQHLDVSWDGKKILFAYCAVDKAPANRAAHPERTYHIYEVGADGSGLRQLTDGPYDDFAPRYLPTGRILFISTRRGGYHRCGAGPCPVYTMAVMEADGSRVRVISFHETHEWDPAVMNDGRIVYTRWDYVDRNAVHYQQLWSVRPDGSDVRIFFGNNTFNPVGIWEARAVPGSKAVMATAAAHHAMTAGSIILLDVAKGADGLDPIRRLTPDALFPESEYAVQRWRAPGGAQPRAMPPEQRRWPGHCYRTPYPLSPSVFLVAYSYEPLIGEPKANSPNMFGIYLADRFGNKELLYRDPNIGSLWPMPLRPRTRPPALASQLASGAGDEGTFFVQNIYQSWPQLPREERVAAIRVIQVLPKTTPHINNPRVGLANASPGKQVLGTVPVEADGSAYFKAPARVPLSFQALDEQGRAIQTMRSLTYLQPGERASCVGCHAHTGRVPQSSLDSLALKRPPSDIRPGPDGSKPLSYPILVQPVLDRHCVKCHSGAEPDGNVRLTGEPEGSFSVSYNALAPRVAFAEWKGGPKANAEPLTWPDTFGARASPLAKLIANHHDVHLSAGELERLYTWMDANALFYGTFDPAEQKRQQRGERIAGPALE